MSKSSSSSSIITIHDGKPKNENVKQQLSSIKDNHPNKELTENESDVDESDNYSLNPNNNSFSSDSNSEDFDFDVYEYSCDPMIYHLLNDNDIYKHDQTIALNEEYYNERYSDDQILEINSLKDNIQSFISDFNIENYEINNNKNDVTNISNNKKYLTDEDEEWIQDECLLNYNLLYNSIDQETNYLSTYEDEWLRSLTNDSKIEYNTKINILKFPSSLLVEGQSFEIIQLKDIQFLKMNENIDDVMIYKYYDMLKTKALSRMQNLN